MQHTALTGRLQGTLSRLLRLSPQKGPWMPLRQALALPLATALAAACTPEPSQNFDADSEEPAEIPINLSEWFADYNAGLGLDYLDVEPSVLLDGDPRIEEAPRHTYYQDIPYGPLDRNRLDLWQAESDEPTPLAIYIHGGGFRNGDKDYIYNEDALKPLLKRGISVASITYRWAHMDGELALESEAPNGAGNDHDVDGARLDYILRDCARAVQFMRYRQDEFNLDGERFGAWGGSAGAGCAVWTATVPDLADPTYEDPVLAESSKLIAVGHLNSQVSYNFNIWPDLLNLDPEFVWNLVDEGERLLQLSREDQQNTELGQDLSEVLDFYAWMGPGDANLYTHNSAEDSDETTIQSDAQIVHHPRGHVALYERCVDVGLVCEIQTTLLSSDFKGEVTHFLVGEFGIDG
jgi:acetyl esterase/lipase